MLKIKISIILLSLSFISFLFYTKTLHYKLALFRIINNVNVGIAVIKDNDLITLSNQQYPLLSVFKYFVAIKVLKYIDQKHISLDAKITINQNMLDMQTHSPMIIDNKSYPFDITLAQLLEYMISKSDNNACDILIEYSGGINELEKFIHELGFNDISIKVNEKDMNSDIYNQYLNTSTPKDIVLMMKRIKDNNILSSSSFAFLENIMLKTSATSFIFMYFSILTQ